MEEGQFNSRTIIGFSLMIMLFLVWYIMFSPVETPNTEDNQQAPKTEQQESQNGDSKVDAPVKKPEPASGDSPSQDSIQNSLLLAQFGTFAPAATGKEQFYALENDLMKVWISSKGARVTKVILKNYSKIHMDSSHKEIKAPLRLMNDRKNRFEYTLPVRNTASGKVRTSDLYFKVTREQNALVFRAPTSNGGYFEQRYALQPDHYEMDYRLAFEGLQNDLDTEKGLGFKWVNYLNKLEINQNYERTMSSVYFKSDSGSPDYCNCRSDDKEETEEKAIKWFSHSNQFFNSTLIGGNFNFTQFVGETKMLDDDNPDLKVLKASATLPIADARSGNLEMLFYVGPNEFDRLYAYGLSLEEIIPFGSSIFGSINRWVIHPLFDFLSRFIGNKGLVILLLTFLVKLFVYPLTYRMVYSQAKMQALKPRIDALRKKHDGDQQKVSVETMKMYNEFGVNPLGSCFPILLQMPIWFALYRFFPAAIEFRQASFLWATDLSSYDVAFYLPTHLPGFGDHISLFTLIWVATTLWYSWYSMKQMDTSAMQNPAMKYVQYLMPVMFMFFFNSFASGLTAYLCLSNMLNITQTVVTKRFLINHDKIREKLEANKAKPKKSGGWRQRFEQAMKEQQKIQAEKEKTNQKRKKK